MTKRFEEVLRGSLEEVSAGVSARKLKGEIVLVIGPPQQPAESADDLDDLLRSALESGSVKDAVSVVVQTTTIPKRDVYRRALELAAEGREKGADE